MLLSHKMLRGEMWEYTIKKIKEPFRKFLIFIAERYPTPTKENTRCHNSHILLDKQERFFSYEYGGRDALFKAAWKILIAEYEHDAYYRYRFDWLLEELANEVIKGNWEIRVKGEPIYLWKEFGERNV